MCYLGVTTTMIELILAGLPYHATAQLKILKYNLRNLEREVPKNEKNLKIRFESVDKVFRDCVWLHNRIL